MKQFTALLFMVIALICAIYVLVSIRDGNLARIIIGLVGLAISLFSVDFTLNNKGDGDGQ